VNEGRSCIITLQFEEDLDFYPKATLMADQTLADYLPKYDELIYTYDMGDHWEHEIELVRAIDDHDAESPYLLEASGQTPPEDVGGVGGFQYFREMMLTPDHPDHREMKEWAGYWSLELSDIDKRPRVIRK